MLNPAARRSWNRGKTRMAYAAAAVYLPRNTERPARECGDEPRSNLPTRVPRSLYAAGLDGVSVLYSRKAQSPKPRT